MVYGFVRDFSLSEQRSLGKAGMCSDYDKEVFLEEHEEQGKTAGQLYRTRRGN